MASGESGRAGVSGRPGGKRVEHEASRVKMEWKERIKIDPKPKQKKRKKSAWAGEKVLGDGLVV